jgi:hypothetical protein
VPVEEMNILNYLEKKSDKADGKSQIESQCEQQQRKISVKNKPKTQNYRFDISHGKHENASRVLPYIQSDRDDVQS